MLIINCPWCGPRDQTEFAYGGEAHIVRPPNPDALSDAQWADYLFMRKNPKGRHLEQWGHAYGCRRWFNVERDTVTYRITATYKPGDSLPPGGGPGRGSGDGFSPVGGGPGRGSAE
jgi:sarcosine oxidase subunit delta